MSETTETAGTVFPQTAAGSIGKASDYVEDALIGVGAAHMEFAALTGDRLSDEELAETGDALNALAWLGIARLALCAVAMITDNRQLCQENEELHAAARGLHGQTADDGEGEVR